jgi:hypothetical protein
MNPGTSLTAMVSIFITPSTALLTVVLPLINWTLPSGFFVFPVKYLTGIMRL